MKEDQKIVIYQTPDGKTQEVLEPVELRQKICNSFLASLERYSDKMVKQLPKVQNRKSKVQKQAKGCLQSAKIAL